MADRQLQAQQDTIRVPVYDTEGFRTDIANLDQTLINCFAEVVRNPVTGDGEIVATKRDGIMSVTTVTFTTHFTGTANSQYALANYVVTNLYDVYVSAWLDGTNIRIIQYRPQAGTTTLIGTITGVPAGDHKVYLSHGWTKDKDNPTWTLIVTYENGNDGTSKAYTAEASGTFPNIAFTATSLNQITGATSPWGASIKTRGPVLQYNNQWYVATLDGNIYSTGNTEPNQSYVTNADIVTVGPNYQSWCDLANFIKSEFPEQFETCILYKHHLLAVGKTSIQFFTDEGEAINPGVSILPTDQALIRFGTISGKHVLNVDDVLYWIGYGKDNTLGLWKLDGYTPVKISTKKQDQEIIRTYQGDYVINQSNLFCCVMGNKKHIGISAVDMFAMTFGTDFNGVITGAGLTQRPVNTWAKASFAMYSLEDKTWWYLSLGQGVSVLYPATSFGNPYTPIFNSDPWYQYLLRGNSVLSDAPAEGHQKLYAITPNVFLDNYVTSDITFGATGTWVQMTLQTNGIEFQNLKRKRINRVTLAVGNSYKLDTVNPTYVGSLILSWNKTNNIDFNDNDITSRLITIPNTSFRYYFNNLGMARHISFCLTEKSPYPISFKYFEIDVAQGTG